MFISDESQRTGSICDSGFCYEFSRVQLWHQVNAFHSSIFDSHEALQDVEYSPRLGVFYESRPSIKIQQRRYNYSRFHGATEWV